MNSNANERRQINATNYQNAGDDSRTCVAAASHCY